LTIEDRSLKLYLETDHKPTYKYETLVMLSLRIVYKVNAQWECRACPHALPKKLRIGFRCSSVWGGLH